MPRYLWIVESVEPHHTLEAKNYEEAYERVISIRMEDGTSRENAELWFDEHDDLVHIDNAIDLDTC